MLMKNKLNYLLVLFSSFLFSWIIPYLYEFVTQQSDNPQFIIYSSLEKDFMTQEIIKDDSFVYRDRKGNTFSQYQMDSLVPSIGYKILMLQNRMPDSILGRKISVEAFIHHNFFFSHSPEDINRNVPKLYLLMESEPKRIELSLPNDVFRLTNNGIEFIDLKTNRLIRQKSHLYTTEMKKAGIKFPIKAIGGNPTPLKKYDNGYILADVKNNLFQMKMQNGNPNIIKISNKISDSIKSIFVTEYPDKRFIAFVSDIKDKLYAIDTETKTVQRIGIPEFDSNRDNLVILGNIFDWNIEVNRNGNRSIYAIDNNDLTLLDSMKIDAKTTFWHTFEKYLFPIKTSFTSSNDQFFMTRIDTGNIQYSLYLNLLLLLGFIYCQRKENVYFLIINSVLIILFGIFWLFSYLAFLRNW